MKQLSILFRGTLGFPFPVSGAFALCLLLLASCGGDDSSDESYAAIESASFTFDETTPANNAVRVIANTGWQVFWTPESAAVRDTELEQLSTTMADSNELEIRAMLGVNVLVIQCSEEFILDKMEEYPLDQEKIRSMPGITVYIVQPEDTLWDIAKRFYTTTEEISSMNALENEEISSGTPLLLVKKVEE